jgi:hypothetical protein
MIWEQGCTQYRLRQSIFDYSRRLNLLISDVIITFYSWLLCTAALQIFFFLMINNLLGL